MTTRLAWIERFLVIENEAVRREAVGCIAWLGALVGTSPARLDDQKATPDQHTDRGQIPKYVRHWPHYLKKPVSRNSMVVKLIPQSQNERVHL